MADDKKQSGENDRTHWLEDEINDLKHELEIFGKDKERIRQILGKIGGVPKFETKLVNILFGLAGSS